MTGRRYHNNKSAQPRIDYDFCPVPTIPDPRWRTVRHAYARFLFAPLFMLRGGGPIHFAGDWRSFLMRELCIDGRERGNFARALDALHACGLLSIDEDKVVLSFHPPADTHSTATRQPLDSHSTATRHPPCIHPDLTPRNDSTQICRERERDREREESAREIDTDDTREPLQSALRPGVAGLNWLAATLGRDTLSMPPLGAYAADYAWLGMQPAERLVAAAAAIKADPWCRENAHLVTARHVVRSWGRYSEGGPKPVIAKAGSTPEAAAKLERLRVEFKARAAHAEDDYTRNKLRAEYEQRAARIRANA